MHLIQLEEDRKRNGVNLSYRLYFQRYESALERYKWLHAFLQRYNENFHEKRAKMLKPYDTCTTFHFISQGERIFLINSAASVLHARQPALIFRDFQSKRARVASRVR